MKNDAGRQEQPAFCSRVSDDVYSGAGQRLRAQHRESDHHQTHMADGGKRQEPFQIAFREAHSRAEKSGGHANCQEDDFDSSGPTKSFGMSYKKS